VVDKTPTTGIKIVIAPPSKGKLKKAGYAAYPAGDIRPTIESMGYLVVRLI